MGRLAADPELKRTSSDIPFTNFTVAISRYSKEDPNRTDWIDCIAWRQSAEFITRYFGKGRMISLEGSIQTRTYTDKNGNNRKAVEVLVDRAEFCGDKGTNSGSYSSGFSGNYDPGSPPPVSGQQTSAAAISSGSDDDFTVISDDEDLPF